MDANAGCCSSSASSSVPENLNNGVPDTSESSPAATAAAAAAADPSAVASTSTADGGGAFAPARVGASRGRNRRHRRGQKRKRRRYHSCGDTTDGEPPRQRERWSRGKPMAPRNTNAFLMADVQQRADEFYERMSASGMHDGAESGDISDDSNSDAFEELESQATYDRVERMTRDQLIAEVLTGERTQQRLASAVRRERELVERLRARLQRHGLPTHGDDSDDEDDDNDSEGTASAPTPLRHKGTMPGRQVDMSEFLPLDLEDAMQIDQDNGRPLIQRQEEEEEEEEAHDGVPHLIEQHEQHTPPTAAAAASNAS